jgi:hypothetical protein
MKTILAIATAVLLATLGSARAQSYVLESPVILASSIITQGTDAVTHSPRLATTVTKRLVTTPFTNREVLAIMLERALITGSSSEWTLVYLQDDQAAGGAYARKKASPTDPAPVAVPADLLTLPAFGPSVIRGKEVTTQGGATFAGTTELALATCTVNGVPVSGLATNGIRTWTATIQGTAYQLDTVSTTLAFHGGQDGDPSDRLVTGRIVIGSAKLSPLPTLP